MKTIRNLCTLARTDRYVVEDLKLDDALFVWGGSDLYLCAEDCSYCVVCVLCLLQVVYLFSCVYVLSH